MIEIYAETSTQYRLAEEPRAWPTLNLYRDHTMFGREGVFEEIGPNEFVVLQDHRGLVVRFYIPQTSHGGWLHRIFMLEECRL